MDFALSHILTLVSEIVEKCCWQGLVYLETWCQNEEAFYVFASMYRRYTDVVLNTSHILKTLWF